MPPKRKAVKDAESSSPSQSSTSASDASDIDASGATPRARMRRAGARASAAAASVPHSPALSTRRSTRISAQAEPAPAVSSRGRLTRGRRPGTAGRGAGETPEQAPAKRGKGVRGRPRKHFPPAALEEKPAAPRKRGRPPGRRVTLEINSESESEHTSDSSKDPESEVGLSGKDEEETDSEGIASSEEQSNNDSAEAALLAGKDEEANEAGGNDDSRGGEDDDDDDDKDDEAGISGVASAPRTSRKATPVLVRQGRGRGRGRGRQRTEPLRHIEQAANIDLEDNDLTMDDSERSDFGEDDGELGISTQANLTRRQRAKLTRDYDEELIELPTEAKRSKFSVEEAALRKSEHARRRKFQSMQRAEQLKNDTINRLLNKQTSKGRNKVSEDYDTRSVSAEGNDATSDVVRYIQRVCPAAGERVDAGTDDGGDDARPVHVEFSLSLPLGVDIGAVIPGAVGKTAAAAGYPPPTPLCEVAGCEQKKKYSVESRAACSLEHWRLLKAGSA
ncbi:INO80 complex subunit B [Coemansia thaxteri]|nr:INO80 complex subunit B [Coemansia thaxteri]